MWNLSWIVLLSALALDLLLGDPRWMPHLVRLAGAVARGYETILAKLLGRTRFSGMLFWLLVNGSLLGAYFGLHGLLGLAHPILPVLLDIFLLYQCLAMRDLHDHVVRIEKPLSQSNLDDARRHLSMIVGRDTKTLDAPEISRAAIESVAESTSDGFVAPLFWAVAAGPAGALLYRTSNTLDSIAGYKDERYIRFGWCSARMDDLLNWIPARLTALFYWVIARFGFSLEAAAQDARNHASPNAGWSEAAMAYLLGRRLGGTNFYGGEPHNGPLFNEKGGRTETADVARALRAFWACTALSSAAALAVCLIPTLTQS